MIKIGNLSINMEIDRDAMANLRGGLIPVPTPPGVPIPYPNTPSKPRPKPKPKLSLFTVF
jgi:hypothetical protein